MRDDRATIFECPVCRQAVTRALSQLPDGMNVCYEDGQPAVRTGFFALSDDDYWTGSEGRVLVNLADLVGTHHHSDPARRSGCCGPDGMQGPNLLCNNGHEVATERSDCWMSHAAVLLKSVKQRAAAE